MDIKLRFKITCAPFWGAKVSLCALTAVTEPTDSQTRSRRVSNSFWPMNTIIYDEFILKITDFLPPIFTAALANWNMLLSVVSPDTLEVRKCNMAAARTQSGSYAAFTSNSKIDPPANNNNNRVWPRWSFLVSTLRYYVCKLMTEVT